MLLTVFLFLFLSGFFFNFDWPVILPCDPRDFQVPKVSKRLNLLFILTGALRAIVNKPF